MAIGAFNYKGHRAVQARLGRHLSPWIRWFEVGTVLLLAAGIGLLLLGMAAGWIILGLTVIPAMVVEWYKRALRTVPPAKDGKTVDDLLDSELLGLLPDQPSPKDIVQALAKTGGGAFFNVRFGVGAGFLEQLVSADRQDSEAVFEEALAIARENGGRLSAGVVILAIIRLIPNGTALLGRLQLGEEDLVKGIRWQHRVEERNELLKRPRHTGGIGRDWSFGWIPTLSRFGRNLSYGRVISSGIHNDIIDQLFASLEKGQGSIALVGRQGVGKTDVIYELAGRLMEPDDKVPVSLRYKQVFMLDASSLIAAAPGPGEIEELVNVILSEAFSAKNIIVCLDNAQLFFEEGVGSVDIGTLLQPVLEAGRLPLILTMDEQRYLQLTKRNTALAQAVRRINIPPADEDETLRVLEDTIPAIEYRQNVLFMYQALREAYALGSRYVYDSSMPGQAVTMINAAADFADNGRVTATSIAQAIEKTIGVKTSAVSDDTERDKLLNLEQLIHERMIGQERAVSVVSDALRRARAGVRNQQRPVGTFLFLGPTGVGKTELAKSLAAVYFNGEENMIRLDMNEFVSANDVQRLIADGAEDAGSLTAQVMKQPFSVILLDEIEKAHSSVLTTLLQLLDEGILRDERGREVSFRDAIVIATSNAGADRIQEYLHRGYGLAQFEEQFLNELLASNIFHPEFLNRFDEIVVFGPLSKPELLQVVDLILAGINRTLEKQKITVTVTPEAKEYLVEAGYDPRLGARPMRRVVQRAVENTVAKEMLKQSVESGGSIEISLGQVKDILEKRKTGDAIVEGNK